MMVNAVVTDDWYALIGPLRSGNGLMDRNQKEKEYNKEYFDSVITRKFYDYEENIHSSFLVIQLTGMSIAGSSWRKR